MVLFVSKQNTRLTFLQGLRKFGRPPANGDVKTGIARRKMYGSMSSLPSVSSIGSRHLYGKEKRREGAEAGRGKRPGGRDKTQTKRFQRLESHVVTLARLANGTHFSIFILIRHHLQVCCTSLL